MDRLKRQMDFIFEIDKLKTIYRQSKITDNSKYENDAEHSWHLGLMAIILKEYANGEVDLSKVIKMVLIHDIVEIEAGDVFLYDEKGNLSKGDNELKAAEKLYGLLPEDQKRELFDLWQEFEAKESDDAKFAAVLDRLAPLMMNYKTDGYTWQKHGITSDKVLARLKEMENGSITLWEYAKSLIEECINKGWLKTLSTE